MEILQTIWNALATPNEGLIKLFGMILIFIEMTVTVLLTLSLLNIKFNKTQVSLYVAILSFICIISNIFFPEVVKLAIRLLAVFIAIKLIFKTTVLKSLISVILPMVIMLIIETFFTNLCNLAFHISYENIATIPIYRISVVSLVYLSMFILYELSKKFNFNITLLDNMRKSNYLILSINFIFGIISIIVQFYFNTYSDNLPLFMVLLSTSCLIMYFLVSMYSLSRTTKLEITTQDLEQARLYNKSLKILHDNVRAFKHDFNNIVQAIGRLCFF